MRYEEMDVLMELYPLSDRRAHRYLGTHFLGTEWDTRLQAQVFNFHDPKLHLKISVVFHDGDLYASCPYGDTMKLSDFECSFRNSLL